MVARGDLGVEVPFERLPAIQKSLISACRRLGKMSVTATEMLESMIGKIRPTRAEVSDVANAVYDGSGAVMLSGETAAGSYPVEAVSVMAQVAEATERAIDYGARFCSADLPVESTEDALCHAACATAQYAGAKAIVACSISGATARMVSRFRPAADILGLTTSERTWRSLALSWGVLPALCAEVQSSDALFQAARAAAQSQMSLAPGDELVITGGSISGRSGGTDLIKVERI